MPSSFSTFVTSLQKLPRRTLVTRTRRLARRSRKAMYVSTQMSFSIYVQFWLFKVLKKYKIWNWGFYLLLYNRCQSLSGQSQARQEYLWFSEVFMWSGSFWTNQTGSESSVWHFNTSWRSSDSFHSERTRINGRSGRPVREAGPQ